MKYLMRIQYSVEAPKHIEILSLTNKDDITGHFE